MNVVHQIEKLKEWKNDLNKSYLQTMKRTHSMEKRITQLEERAERLFDLFATMNDALSKLERVEEPSDQEVEPENE